MMFRPDLSPKLKLWQIEAYREIGSEKAAVDHQKVIFPRRFYLAIRAFDEEKPRILLHRRLPGRSRDRSPARLADRFHQGALFSAHVYRREWVEHNYRIFLRHHTLSGARSNAPSSADHQGCSHSRRRDMRMWLRSQMTGPLPGCALSPSHNLVKRAT